MVLFHSNMTEKTCIQLKRPTFLDDCQSSMLKFARRFLSREIYFYALRDVQLSYFSQELICLFFRCNFASK